MLKTKLFSVSVFLILMISSLFSGHKSYCDAQNEIKRDLNNALALTLEQKKSDIITPDTIKVYKNLQQNSLGRVFLAVADCEFCENIHNERLKDNAFISFSIIDDKNKSDFSDKNFVFGDTMIIKNEKFHEKIALTGYSDLSTAAIFSLSDQKTSSVLALMAIAWAFFSLLYMNKKREEENNFINYGGLVYSSTENSFFDNKNNPIHFTPMQHQLMEMFMNSANHTLSKEEICNALWPKKDDASDTLYTLIRRLKPIVEENTNLIITSDRVKGYILEIR